MGEIVIVGSGLAGYALLRELRRLDGSVGVVLLTADDGAAYAKSRLSNSLAGGRSPAELVVATAEQMAHRHRARILPHTRVHRIDRERRLLITNRGEIPWKALVLALGAEARRPSLRGAAADRVLTVASLADYAHFRKELAGRRRVTLLGGAGWGCEFADDLARAGCEVSLLEPSSRLLGGGIPLLSARRLADALEAAGVRLYLDNGIQRIEAGTGGLEVVTFSGYSFAAQVVLATLGSRPRTGLAVSADLDVGEGIRVDSRMATRDPGIFAIGECAEVHGRPLSLPADIEAAAKVLAAVLLGHNASMQWLPRVQTLNIPSCPVALCEPPPVAGEWHESATARGVRALFNDEAGVLRGFVLVGEAVAERDRLVSAVPPATR